MTMYEVKAGDQAFTCPLDAPTEAEAHDELFAGWERSFREGNNTYDVPSSTPATSIDMAPGQRHPATGRLISARGLFIQWQRGRPLKVGVTQQRPIAA